MAGIFEKGLSLFLAVPKVEECISNRDYDIFFLVLVRTIMSTYEWFGMVLACFHEMLGLRENTETCPWVETLRCMFLMCL